MPAMKRVAIATAITIAVAAAALLAYGAWFVRRAVVDDLHVAVTARPAGRDAVEIEILATGSADGAVITEIDMERSLRDGLGLRPPAGFVLEALKLEPREQGDEDAAAYVSRYNREKVRYTGRFEVSRDKPAVLRFPADHPQAASGVIRLQHERKIGLGGSIGFASVTVGAQGGR